MPLDKQKYMAGLGGIQKGMYKNVTSSTYSPVGNLQPKPSALESFGNTALRALNIPINIISGMARGVFQGAKTPSTYWTNPILKSQAIVKGAAKGIQEDYTFSKALKSPAANWIPEPIKPVAGIAADIFLDPTTYLGVGSLTKVGKLAKAATGIQKSLKAGEITSEFAAKSLGKTVGKASKYIPGTTKEVLKDLKLAATPAMQAAKGQRALLSIAGIPLIKGTRVFEGIGKVGKVFKGSNIGRMIMNTFNQFPTAPPELRQMITNSANKINYNVDSMVENIRKIYADLPDYLKEGDTAFRLLQTKGAKLPKELLPIKAIMKNIANQEKKYGLLVNEIENYLPHMMKPEGTFKNMFRPAKEFSTRNIFAEGRKYETLDDFISHVTGAGREVETNIAKLTAKRAAASERIVEYKQLLNDVLKKYGAKAENAPSNYIPSTLKEFAGYKLAPEVAETMERLNKSFFSDEAMKQWVRGYDKLLNVWKGLATAVNPGFHIRNAISNMWQLLIAGVNPGMIPVRMGEAAGIMRGVGSFKGMKAKELVAMAKKLGVLKSDMVMADLAKTMDQIVGEGLRGKLNLANPMYLGRKFGSAIEGNARLALFMDGLAKGLSPSDAADTVRKFLFDYSELSQIEKNVFKRIIPFYSWMRKNIPLQLTNMIKQPGKYTAIEKVRKGIAPEGEQGELPEWAQKLSPWKLPMGDLWLNPNLPFQDISKLPETLTPAGMISSMSPFIKIPIELASGKQMYNQSEIKDMAKYFAGQVPAVNFALKMANPNMPEDEKALNALGYLGGIKIMKIKTDKYKVEVSDELEEKMKKDIQSLRRQVPQVTNESPYIRKQISKPSGYGKKVKKPPVLPPNMQFYR